MTNHGCMAMTLKSKPNHPNGGIQKSLHRKKARQVGSNVKVLLTVHHEFLPQGRTVNTEYYLEGICQLHEAIRQERKELWKNQSWILHQLIHRRLCVRIRRPWAPLIVFLVPKLNTPMKEKRFATIEEIKERSNHQLF